MAANKKFLFGIIILLSTILIVGHWYWTQFRISDLYKGLNEIQRECLVKRGGEELLNKVKRVKKRFYQPNDPELEIIRECTSPAVSL